MDVQATGEFLVPGKSPETVEHEHYERYRFASRRVMNKNVLDIACGVGYGCELLSEAGARNIVGVDLSDRNIEYAREQYGGRNIAFVNRSIYDIDYDSEFDLITCFETVEHVDNDNLALRKLHNALRCDGELIISTPNRKIASPKARTIADKPANDYHCREYTLEELKELVVRNGFEIKEIYGQRNRLFVPVNILNKLMNRIFKPDEKGNSELRKVSIGEARYYTLILKKTVR